MQPHPAFEREILQDREAILDLARQEPVSNCRRCINLIIRIFMILLVGVAIAMVPLFTLGWLGKIHIAFLYASPFVSLVCCVLVAFLMICENRLREDSALKQLRRLNRWARRHLNRIRRRPGAEALLAPPENALLLPHDNRSDDTSSNETSPDDASQPRSPIRYLESEITTLTRFLLRRHSDTTLPKTNPSQATTAEPRLMTELRQSLSTIPSNVPGPVRFWQSRPGEGLDTQVLNLLQPLEQVPSSQLARPGEPDSAQIFRRVTDSNLARQNLQTLDVQQLPGQTQSLHMTSPEASIPGSSSELRLRHPVQRPGLAAWSQQETQFSEFPREEQQSTSSVTETAVKQSLSWPSELTITRPLQEAVDELSTPRIPSELARSMEPPVQLSRSERARHGQSWPTELTMIEPLQQAMDELSTSRIPSELARPVGLPVQRSRGLTGGDEKKPDPQNLDVQQLPDHGPNLQLELHEYLPIPGAVSELQTRPRDPIQGQGWPVSPRQERPAQSPYLLVQQQEPGSRLQTSSQRERQAQGPRLIVLQRQQGPLRIRQRTSQGPDSEDSRSQQEPEEGSENQTEETTL